MDIFKIIRYSSAFEKAAEYGPDNDSFTNVIKSANEIIQKFCYDNKKELSREYFGGNDFSVSVIDGDSSTSIIYISTKPSIQSTKGVERATNVLYFENELTDKVRPLGVKIKVRNL
jgi:hypothetical protein